MPACSCCCYARFASTLELLFLFHQSAVLCQGLSFRSDGGPSNPPLSIHRKVPTRPTLSESGANPWARPYHHITRPFFSRGDIAQQEEPGRKRARAEHGAVADVQQ